MDTTVNALRSAFLEYFAEQGHEVVPSSSLVPHNDPSLLFTNAGMVQFKDVFLGAERRANSRATSAQRCVRAGGKHNDLENVGYTARHHTFFEMLGNFSFGDYFKEDAIRFAWEFVTQRLGLPADRLWCTVYEQDDEAASIWLDEIGVSPERFARLGEKDNFWAMGDTGPCGPCSEIFYDHGSDVPGGPPGSADEDGDRYVEIWNLVFMQFDRSAGGDLVPLPKPSVDTGMGLERIAAVMQGVHSNYEIDLFARLIDDAAFVTNAEDRDHSSLRVIADHIRASSFLIADGVLPSNEGRGYVLRRIIRRAARHGFMLGTSEPFFHKLVRGLAETMGDAYPELVHRQVQVTDALLEEEKRFAQTLSDGMGLLEEAIAGLDGKTIPGEMLFKLYDTFGFPIDLTADIARERGLEIDEEGFEESMAGQRSKSKAASQFAASAEKLPIVDDATEFVGYDSLTRETIVTAIYVGDSAVERLQENEEGWVVLEATPFYAESGGQVGDMGNIVSESAVATVLDTQKLGGAHGHRVKVSSGTLGTGARVEAKVDSDRRQRIVHNHSATHLLHAALRTVLGEHVQQKGSLVAPDRLRFDFAHGQPLSVTELEQIERLVNAQIQANAAAVTRDMSFDDAVAAGAMAFFGDKYGAEVRVLNIGEFSLELCGGTHVDRAGDIGLFKIVSETGIAAGVRRVEAVAGMAAIDKVEATDALVRELGKLLKGGQEDLPGKVSQLLDKNRRLEKEIETLRARLASGGASDLTSQVREVAGIQVLSARLDGVDAKSLRDAVDRMKDKLGSGVVVLGTVEDGKVRLVAGVTKDLTGKLRAGDVIGPVAERVGGRGGGRPDLAQAGGNDPDALDGALAQVPIDVEAALGA